MTRPTLFAQLALRLRTQPETLAAEALAHVVAGAPAARLAVAEVCAIAAPGIPARLEFRIEQRTADDASTAVVGTDADGAVRVVVEPRFWAGLPEDQPVRSLRRLAADRASALLVLAPEQRFTSLWAELRRRCRLAELPLHGDRAAGDPMRWTRVGPGQTLILASWPVLLTGIRTQLVAASEPRLISEIDQLAQLCQQMDSDAFLPLAAEELATVTPRRIMQLHRLLDDLTSVLEARRLAESSGLGLTTGVGYAGRYLRAGSSTLFLCLSVDRWATLRETPFWLLLYDASRRPARGAEARLEPLAAEIPPRVLRDPDTDCPLVPLFLRVGVERDAVLADLARQVEEVLGLLGEVPTGGFGSRGAAASESLGADDAPTATADAFDVPPPPWSSPR